MSPRLTVAEVEARVRTALLTRSTDVPSDVAAGPAAFDEAPPPALRPLPPSEPARSPRRARVALAVGAVVVAVGAAIVAVAVEHQPPLDRQSVATRPGGTGALTPPSLACGSSLPLLVEVPGAGDAQDGPAPGSPPPADGQLVVHWPRPAGAVEVRWPAPAPPSFAPRLNDPALVAGTVSTPTGRLDIDVRTRGDAAATDPGAFEPDVSVDRRPELDAGERPAPPCDVVQLTVETGGGRWVTGLRVTPPARGAAFETVDLEARVVERRAVAHAPTTAVRCEGTGDGRPPANRSGGPAPHVRGAEPVDVLGQYLAATPGAVRTGYVEMTAPDGSVTFGVDAGGRGWTTLVFVARDPGGEGWSLAGWTASGC